jgi:hypothetical protein
VNNATTGLPAAHSAIQSEQTARADADTANATSISTLSAQVNNVTTGLPAAHSAIQTEQTARADGDTANANSISTLSAQVNNATTGLPAAHSAIQTEQTTRANGDTANANSISTLSAQVNNITTGLPAAHAAIQTEESTRADGDTANANSISTVQARAVNSASALSQAEIQNALDAFTSGASLTALTSNVAIAQSELQSTAEALRSEVVARSALVATVAENSAAIQTEQTARANADSANASSISTVQARLNTGDFAAVKTQATATADALGGVMAKYLMMVDANGHIAAIELTSGGDAGQMIFLADKFAFVKPDGTGTPKQVLTLGVINGVAALGLDGELIIDGSILARTIVAESITADRIAPKTLTAVQIADLAVNTLQIAGNAVTATYFNETVSNIPIPNTIYYSYADVFSFSYNHGHSDSIPVSCSVYVNTNATGYGSTSISISLDRLSGGIWYSIASGKHVTTGSGSCAASTTLLFGDTAPAGDSTYRVRVNALTTPGYYVAGNVLDASVSLTGVKR